MKEQYRINVLDDGDFDNLHKKLPYMTKKKLEESIGFANPKTGEAYIRRTGVKDWDDETILHEVNELVSTISPDEEDGIRYKGWGKPFRALFGSKEQKQAQAGTIFGNLLGGGGGGGVLGSLAALALAPLTYGASLAYLPAMATAGGAITGGMAGKGLKGALMGALQGYGMGAGLTTLGGAATGLAKGGLAGAIPGATKAFGGYGINPQIGKLLGGVGGAGAGVIPPGQTVATVAGKAVPFSQTVQGAGMTYPFQTGLLGKVSPTLAPSVQEAVKPTVGAGIAQTLTKPSTLMGAGLLTASMLPKTPTFEEPAEFAQLKEQIRRTGQGTDEFYAASRGRLKGVYDDALADLDASYNKAGVYGSGEHLAERNKLRERQARQESMLAFEIDQATLDDMLGLTGLSVQLAAQKYSADLNDVAQLREILGLGGALMLQGGLA